ncbi:MAG: hypothetical protein HY913_03495 [Desulfomonile tiedjei]|nr:hypothetical protein [Desulfomonile tiedjei]
MLTFKSNLRFGVSGILVENTVGGETIRKTISSVAAAAITANAVETNAKATLARNAFRETEGMSKGPVTVDLFGAGENVESVRSFNRGRS